GPTDRVLAEHADQLEANGVWTPGVRLPVYKVPTIDAAAAPLLRAANLTVRPAPKADPVVTNINLDIHAGERIAVMGANGTGKTTLLIALAGLLACHGDITGRPPVMVFQNPEHQFLAHSVHDELRFGLTPDEHTEAAIQRLSTAFGI